MATRVIRLAYARADTCAYDGTQVREACAFNVKILLRVIETDPGEFLRAEIIFSRRVQQRAARLCTRVPPDARSHAHVRIILIAVENADVSFSKVLLRLPRGDRSLCACTTSTTLTFARARCYFRCPGIETRWVSYSNVRQHYVTTRQLRYLRIRKRRLALTAQRCCEYVAFLYPLKLWKLPPGVREIVDRLMDSLIKGGGKLIHFIRFVMIMQYDNYVYSNLWLIVQTCRLEIEENFENYLIKLILDSRGEEDSICIDDRRSDVTIKPY